ncbi:MAG: DUF2061 domain-containing protein [Planctomycetes bacterium]|nr:DUF2061 domain-containing protein [Planctomycetota bacterium]
MHEKPYRSVLKALSWRLTGTLDTILVSFLISGRIRIALSIGVVELFTKLTLYYLHERAWNRIPFGRARDRSPEYSI